MGRLNRLAIAVNEPLTAGLVNKPDIHIAVISSEQAAAHHAIIA
jgi:hypothetical protein